MNSLVDADMIDELYAASQDGVKVELIIPSAWLTWVKPGTPFRFAIDDWERRFDAAPGCHHLVAFGRHGEALRTLLDRFGIIVRY